MAQILQDPVLSDANEIVIEECHHRAASRHINELGRRLESWNDADQVAEQDEHKKRAERFCVGGQRARAYLVAPPKKKVKNPRKILWFLGGFFTFFSRGRPTI